MPAAPCPLWIRWDREPAQIFAARSSGYLAHEFARLAAEVIRQAQEVL
jgi:hypothetical protein